MVTDAVPTLVEPRLFMGKLSVLLIESQSQEQEIMAQILAGFAVKTVIKRANATSAMSYLQHDPADLIMVAAALPGMDGYDLIRNLRTAHNMGGQKAPILLLAAHTRAADVVRARNCGASWVLVKPITPQVLYQRIAWLARDDRAFIQTKAYSGPDRRIRNEGPPAGVQGRRGTDLSLEVGEATEGNLSQMEIDALMNPKRASR